MPLLTKAELEYRAKTKGWTVPKTLTMLDVRKAEPELMRYWEVFCPDVLNAALNSKANAEKAEAEQIQKKWRSPVITQEDSQRAYETAIAFHQMYPQYVVSEENGQAFVKFMTENNLSPFEIRSYTKAFEHLALAGKISLLVNDKVLTGAWLQRAIQVNEKLLDPQKRLTAEQKAGQEALEQLRNTPADVLKKAIEQEFRAENPRVSVFEQRRVDQAAATLYELRPSYKNTEANNSKISKYLSDNGLQIKADSLLAAFDYLSSLGELELVQGVAKFNGTKVIDYGERKRGGTATLVGSIDKYSLRQKLNSMSAAQYAEWIKNPTNAAALAHLDS